MLYLHVFECQPNCPNNITKCGLSSSNLVLHALLTLEQQILHERLERRDMTTEPVAHPYTYGATLFPDDSDVHQLKGHCLLHVLTT